MNQHISSLQNFSVLKKPTCTEHPEGGTEQAVSQTWDQRFSLRATHKPRRRVVTESWVAPWCLTARPGPGNALQVLTRTRGLTLQLQAAPAPVWAIITWSLAIGVPPQSKKGQMCPK